MQIQTYVVITVWRFHPPISSRGVGGRKAVQSTVTKTLLWSYDKPLTRRPIVGGVPVPEIRTFS